MKRILHLLLISILIYFLFFQNVKEGLNEKKCDNIYLTDTCNNTDGCYMFENKNGTKNCINFREKNMDCKTKERMECSKDVHCGHLITGNKSSCVLDFYDKKNSKHKPFYSQEKYKTNKNYIQLNDGNVYKYGVLENGKYTGDRSLIGNNVSKTNFNPLDPPLFKINLTNNLIIKKDTYNDGKKSNVKYNLKDAIQKAFPMYEQDGKDNFTVVLNILKKGFTNPNVYMNFDKENSILEVDNLPNEFLNNPNHSLLFYIKKGKSLLCEGDNTPEICKYKTLIDDNCGEGNDISCGKYKTLNDALEACDKDDECGYVNTIDKKLAEDTFNIKNLTSIKNSPNASNPQVAWCLKRKYTQKEGTKVPGKICYKKNKGTYFERNDFFGCSGSDLEGPGGIIAPWNNKQYMCGAFDRLSDAKKACLDDTRCQAVTTWFSGWGGKDYNPKRQDQHPSRKGLPLLQVPSQDPDGVIPIDEGKPQGIWCLKGKNNENDKNVTVNPTQGNRGSTCYLLKLRN